MVWDQRQQLVYSDSFIHIEQPDKVIEGYGFEGHTTARGDLSSYTLRKPTGILPFDKAAIEWGARTTRMLPGRACCRAILTELSFLQVSFRVLRLDPIANNIYSEHII